MRRDYSCLSKSKSSQYDSCVGCLLWEKSQLKNILMLFVDQLAKGGAVT